MTQLCAIPSFMPPEWFHSKYTNIPYQKHFCLNKLFHSPATPEFCAVNQNDSSKKEVSGIGECLGEPSGHNIHLRPEKAFHNPPFLFQNNDSKN